MSERVFRATGYQMQPQRQNVEADISILVKGTWFVGDKGQNS